MKKINSVTIKCVSWIYSFIVTLLLVLIAAGFIYIFQKSRAADKVFAIRTHLIAAFEENENIADAITAKYTTLLHNRSCAVLHFYNERNIYGFNFSDSSANSYFNGSLLSATPLDREGKCLVQAASFIVGTFNHSDLITRNGFRYILSENDRFIYTFSHLESTAFDVTHSKMFNDMRSYVDSVPEYYKRKLTNNIKAKGTVATSLYEDKLSKTKSYSVVSFIYDLNYNHQPVAYLLYDHTRKELSEETEHYVRGMPWLNVSIIENKNADPLCFIGCNNPTALLSEKISEPLTWKYTLQMKIDIFRSIISSLMFKILIVLAIAHTVLLKSIIQARMFSNQNASVIDELTGLYNRKVISLIANKITDGSFIVMIDCNMFKQINDLYGHNAGDEVLIFIADTIKHSTRKRDIAIRHGGDEFLVILDVYNPDDAASVVSRISELIAANEFQHGHETFKASISYGISLYKGDISLAIHEADKAMYTMKHDLKISSTQV